jgi:hypothetical protein
MLLAACSGHGSGASCSDSTDCSGELECAGPNDPHVCGIPPREECPNDSGCQMPMRCHAIADGCSPDGIGSECRQACTNDFECGAGFRCATGACVAVLCNAGATCAPRQVCDPSRITAITPVFDRTAGCFEVTCADGSTCNGRFCVNGTCQDSPGTCRTVMQVP